MALDETALVRIDGTAVRLSGLYSPGRYWTERYLPGPVVDGYVNMVHRTDAAGMIAHLLESDRERERAVNVVDDEPASRTAFAEWLAERCGVDPPETLSRAAARSRSDVSRRVLASKRVANDRLRSPGYDLAVPTFREGYEPAFEEKTE